MRSTGWASAERAVRVAPRPDVGMAGGGPIAEPACAPHARPPGGAVRCARRSPRSRGRPRGSRAPGSSGNAGRSRHRSRSGADHPRPRAYATLRRRTRRVAILPRSEADASRPREAPAAREGPRRRPLPRAARRPGPRPRSATLAGALQPRVPPDVRRDAAPVPPDAPDGACRRAAAQHRSPGRRDLPRRRPAQRRLVHHQLHARVRPLADGVPRRPSSRARAGRRSRPACCMAYARPQSSTFGEDSAARARLAWSPIGPTQTGGDQMLKSSRTSPCGWTTRTRRSRSTPRSWAWSCARTSRCPSWANFRWLTVGLPGQDVALALMEVPGPPVFDAETQAQIKALVAKGVAGGLFFATDDCQGSFEELSAAASSSPGADRAAVRHRRGVPRLVGQPDPHGTALGTVQSVSAKLLRRARPRRFATTRSRGASRERRRRRALLAQARGDAGPPALRARAPQLARNE